MVVDADSARDLPYSEPPAPAAVSMRNVLLIAAVVASVLVALLGPGIASAVITGLVLVSAAGIGGYSASSLPRPDQWTWVAVTGGATVGTLPVVVMALGGQPAHGVAGWAMVLGPWLILTGLVLRIITRDGSIRRHGVSGLVMLAAMTLAWNELMVRGGALSQGPALALAAIAAFVIVGAVVVLLSEWPQTKADRCLVIGPLLTVFGGLLTAASPQVGVGLVVIGGTVMALGPVQYRFALPEQPVPIWRSWAVIGVSSLVLPLTTMALGLQHGTDLIPSAVAELLLVVAWGGVLWRMVRERARHAGMVTELTETDSITGLPNRQRFLTDVADALESTTRDTVAVTVVLVAMENFAELRTRLGQSTADEIQLAAARRLAPAAAEAMSAAHLSGDVFGLLFDVMSHDRAASRAQHLVEMLREPLELPQLSLSVGAVVGLASGQSGSVDASGLVAAAELALTAARGSAGPIVRYTPELQRRDALAAQLVGELSDGISRGEIVVYFQPQLDLATGQVTGAEALVRWTHPSLGLLLPSAFVPAAEVTGSIRMLTLHVLDQALYWCARWSRAGRPINVSVNLSARDLLHARLVDDVRHALARYGLPASRLELEVTETMAMADVSLSQRVLTDLARLGVTISIDDYGTGYGSLAYLQQLPVRRLKIDRSFVSRILDDEASTAIVRSTVELANQLGLDTVAEGVEDDATVQRLKEFGCTSVQGFGIAAPMSPEGFERAIWRLEHRARPNVQSRSARTREQQMEASAYPSVAQAYQELSDPGWWAGDVQQPSEPVTARGGSANTPARVPGIPAPMPPSSPIPVSNSPEAGSHRRATSDLIRVPLDTKLVKPDEPRRAAEPGPRTPDSADQGSTNRRLTVVEQPPSATPPERRTRRELRAAQARAAQGPTGAAGSVGGLRAAAAPERTTGIDPA